MIAVSIIGKENNPLFISETNPDLKMRIEIAVHSSLDVIEKRTEENKNQIRDPYFGTLGLFDEFSLFAFVSNTKIKVILILDAFSDIIPSDVDIKSFLFSLYSLYVDYCSNPFVKIATYSEKFPSALHMLQPSIALQGIVSSGLVQSSTESANQMGNQAIMSMGTFDTGAPEEGPPSDPSPFNDRSSSLTKSFQKKVFNLMEFHSAKLGGSVSSSGVYTSRAFVGVGSTSSSSSSS